MQLIHNTNPQVSPTVKPNKQSELTIKYQQVILSPYPVSSPEDSHRYFLKIWNKQLMNLQEQVYVMYLNNNNEIIAWRCLTTGTCDSVLVDVKLTLSLALSCMASKIIIAHNHPGSILSPSPSDIAITKKLKEAASIFDIELIDHLILANSGFYSFKRNGLL